MEVELKPEIEKLIQQHVDSGAYSSIEEFVERAIVMFHDRPTSKQNDWEWLSKLSPLDEDAVEAIRESKKQKI